MTVEAAGRDGEVCITCGDVAVALAVVSVDGDTARCRDGDGREGDVAVELVGAVVPGDRVLVHAGVALLRLDGRTREGSHEVRRRVP